MFKRSISSSILVIFLAACGGTGGGGSDPEPTQPPSAETPPAAETPPPAEAPTLDFAVSAKTAVVSESYQLEWSSTNASSCLASGDWSGTKDVSGSETFVSELTGVKVYELSCSGDGGDTASSASIEIVQQPPPPIQSSCPTVSTVPTEGACDGVLLLDPENIKSQSDGIEVIEGPSGQTAIRLVDGQSVQLKDTACTAYGQADQDFTIAMWFKVESGSGYESTTLIGTSNNFSFVDGFILFTDVRDGQRIVTAYTSKGEEFFESPRIPIREDVWHHVALVYDGVQSTFSLMLDGLFYGETWELPNRPHASDFYQTGQLRLGNSGLGDPTVGLSDIQSFQRKLSAAEVRSLYLDNAEFDDEAFNAAVQSLSGHFEGMSTLSTGAFDSAVTDILDNRGLMFKDKASILAALGLIETYETTQDPLFTVPPYEISREKEDGETLAVTESRAFVDIQQAVMDTVFTSDVVASCDGELDKRAWQTASRFPGDAPATEEELQEVYTVKVDASKPRTFGSYVGYTLDPARRPTGLYLPPGSVGTVTVPESMVGKGYTVLVGATTRVQQGDAFLTRAHRRLPNVSRRYLITSVETTIANSVGGGLYIEVPYLADAGLVDVSFTGVIEAPFYSKRSFDMMTEEEWQERSSAKGPWAEFVTDKYMMQMPRDWVYAKPDMEAVLDNFDQNMDGFSEFFGFLPEDRNDVILYMQPDVWIRHGSGGTGYPQINFPYDLNEEWFGDRTNSGLSFLTGTPDDFELHELGHTHTPDQGPERLMFRGELEAIVNFPYVYVENVKFGMDLDEAFLRSMGTKPDGDGGYTIDEAAIHWMITENFRNGNEMSYDYDNHEFQYQHRGYAKYADIVRLWGWEPLRTFHRQINLDIEAGVDRNPLDLDPTDNRILRLSREIGADMTPLIHFWGIHPVDSVALKAAMDSESLTMPSEIETLLIGYRDLIPADNAAFRSHYLDIWPSQPEGGDPIYGYGWYNVWKEIWDETYAAATRDALDDIIDLYYP